MKHFLIKTICLLSTTMVALSASSQLSSITIEPVHYHEQELGNTDIIPAGAVTYHVYANFESPNDYLSAVFGNSDCGALITSTEPIFQSSIGSENAEDVNPLLFATNPEIEYDSFITIGKLNSSDEGSTIYTLEDPASPWIDSFEQGGALSIDSESGGLWFVLYDGSGVNAIAGTDQRVLIAQITTTGTLTGQASVQYFPEGDPGNNTESACTVMTDGTVIGCTDENACNYDPLANLDNNLCEYPEEFYDCSGNCINDSDEDGTCDELEVLGCTDPLACNYDETATEEDDSCEYPEEFYDCSGNCINDSDEDGTCDELEVLGCTDPLACNYDETATEDDDSCEYPDEFYDCDGLCINDADNDGICDELEVLGCTDPLACNYNADATEDDDSCAFSFEVEVTSFNPTCVDLDDGSISLVATLGQEPYSFNWSNQSTGAELNGIGAGTYEYTVTDAAGCEVTGFVELENPSDITFSLTIIEPSCTDIADGSIIASVISGEDVTLEWISPIDAPTTGNLTNIGVGEYILLGTDQNGCQKVETIELTSDDSGCLLIPTGITPNNDGFNDTWVIQGSENYPEISVQIYNRWGQELLNSKGYQEPWDAIYNGTTVPMASYYYVITLGPSVEPMTGYLTVKY